MEFENISPKALPGPYRYYFNRKFKREELIEKIAEEIRNNPAFHEYLQGFRVADVDSVVRSYAQTKASVLLDSKHFQSKLEFHDTVIEEYASERFWDIQQKKLFDLQCEWRAEKITIPGIESTWDFRYWGENIQQCTFISPVTEEELNLYIDFLRSSNEDLTSNWQFTEWQEYGEFKDNENDSGYGIELPGWYEFHNLRTGNGILLTLPDIRGKKEEFYRKIWSRHQNKEAQERDTRPLLFFHDQEVEFFQKLETPEFVKMFVRFEKMKEIINSQEEVEEALEFLKDLHHEVPIEAHDDWRQAIIHAKYRYINQMVANEMPRIFEQYQMRQAMGITYEQAEKDMKSFYESLKDPIREGRKLNGEPGDFNF